MYFQKILKGINGLTIAEVNDIVRCSGISSNLLRNKGNIDTNEIKDLLLESNVIDHLNFYADPLPPGHPYATVPGSATYGDVSAFVSTTAGAVQRDSGAGLNITFPSFLTSLEFATNNYTSTGYLFYGFVMTLGRKSVPLLQFAEEVRELHIYRQFLPYHKEGEIVAKLFIPVTQIEKAEEYNGPSTYQTLCSGGVPVPVNTIDNPDYLEPENYSNIREFL